MSDDAREMAKAKTDEASGALCGGATLFPSDLRRSPCDAPRRVGGFWPVSLPAGSRNLAAPTPASPWIKVCGVRSRGEVEACARAGATHVGLNSWPRSPRYLAPRELRLLAEAAFAEGLSPVVVHVAGSPLALGLFERLPGHLLQSSSPPMEAMRRRMAEAGVLWIEARPARPELAAALPRGDVLLVDACVGGMHGGTGRRIDPALLRDVPRPYVLAGGLNPDNVAEAVLLVSPGGVDAASGLESSPGVKDPGRVRAYCQAAREAFEKVRRET